MEIKKRVCCLYRVSRLVQVDKDDRYTYGIGRIKSDIHGFYLYNAHGDVVQLTNTSGVVTKNYLYDAFGVETNKDNADNNPFRYCAEYYDKETDTIYLRNRYYDPNNGRFSAEDTYWNVDNMIYGDDPLYLTAYTYMPDIDAIMQSSNLYVYCANNPVMFIDPSGLTMKGDEKYSASVQKQLDALGKQWNAASSQKERDKIHQQANALRKAEDAKMKNSNKPSPQLVSSLTLPNTLLPNITLPYTLPPNIIPFIPPVMVPYNPDPFARPGQKEQGRENKEKKKKNGDWQPNPNKRQKPLKKHTPGKDHRKYEMGPFLPESEPKPYDPWLT